MSKKVLIIDDEALIRSAMVRLFTKKNFIVKEAVNGKEGVRIWRDFCPDIVCLDFMMPELNGIEVLSEIPENLKKTIIIMSAYVGDAEKEIFLKKGAKMFINKPFDDIFKVIEEVEKISNG